MLYEHARPEDPWITPESARLLRSMLRPADVGVEFGSGRSTVWLARRTSHLTSVEHDKHWYDKVSAGLRDAGLTNVDYIHHARDQPRELGDMSAYARTALAFDDASIDFVLVDGLYREHVTKFIMPKLKPGGLLIIDNVNWYLPSRTRAPASRTLVAGPDGPLWSALAEQLADWRMIWTSSGVWDTAIFIKP